MPITDLLEENARKFGSAVGEIISGGFHKR